VEVAASRVNGKPTSPVKTEVRGVLAAVCPANHRGGHSPSDQPFQHQWDSETAIVAAPHRPATTITIHAPVVTAGVAATG
jgi:hypothetical protein